MSSPTSGTPQTVVFIAVGVVLAVVIAGLAVLAVIFMRKRYCVVTLLTSQ